MRGAVRAGQGPIVPSVPSVATWSSTSRPAGAGTTADASIAEPSSSKGDTSVQPAGNGGPGGTGSIATSTRSRARHGSRGNVHPRRSRSDGAFATSRPLTGLEAAHPSQSSPIPSKSASSWSGFGSAGQLSSESQTPSPAESGSPRGSAAYVSPSGT